MLSNVNRCFVQNKLTKGCGDVVRRGASSPIAISPLLNIRDFLEWVFRTPNIDFSSPQNKPGSAYLSVLVFAELKI